MAVHAKLNGRKICIAGNFSMTHEEIATKVLSYGGTIVKSPTQDSIMLVGDKGGAKAKLGRKLKLVQYGIVSDSLIYEPGKIGLLVGKF